MADGLEPAELLLVAIAEQARLDAGSSRTLVGLPDVTPARSEAIRKLLTTTTPNGKPMLLVDPRCAWLIAALGAFPIDREGAGYLPHLFGPAGFAVIRKPDELPARLPLFYAQLTR